MNDRKATRRRALFAVSFLLVAVVAQADTARIEQLSPGAKPVSADLLSGTTLIVPADGFAVSAPSTSWQWFTGQVPEKQADIKTRFLAFNAETERFIEIQAIRLEFPPLTDRNVRDLLTQMLTNVPGAQASSLKYSPVPNRANAYRYSYEVDDAGDRIPMQGAVIRANRLFMLTMATLDSAEVSIFDTLLASFKLVDTKGQAPPVTPQSLLPPATSGRTQLSGATFYPLISILVLLIASAVKDHHGVPRRNPGSIALLVLAVAVPFGIIVAIDPNSQDPLHVSSTIGRHVGSAIVGAAIALFFFRRHRRRAAQAATDVDAPAA